MKKIFLILPLSMLLFAVGCNRSMEHSEEALVSEVSTSKQADYAEAPEVAAADVAAGAAVDAAANPVNPVNQQLKIIRRGDLSIESKDIQASKKNLDVLLKKMGGYYEQESSTSNRDELTTYNLVIRVPSKQLDAFMGNLENGKDKITSKSMTSEDVSILYYDVESRLKSKRAYLARYQGMVASAKSVKDLLEIQEQIRLLQEEIDSSEGLLRNLGGQVDYSSININLFEYNANLPMGSNSFWSRLKDSFVFGWNLIETLALGIVGLWPVLIVVGLAVALIKKFRKNRKNKFLNKE
ncbi:DUF4349 domain-containing protein [Sphingobacterium sp. PU5-4]|uniref:DUF4349 domain-containing protein n=1 Tax=Sphingobacterium tenebrionis TaxID=3111775 RepID=A0ABU8I1T5_9SPHI